MPLDPSSPNVFGSLSNNLFNVVLVPGAAGSSLNSNTDGYRIGVQATAAPRTSVDGTIANGQSLSGAIDCRPGLPCALVMPAAWTAAALTFQTSSDGGVTFNDLFDAFGNEYVVQAAASRRIVLTPADFLSVTHLRIRSGTAATPVNQGASRTVRVILAP